MSSVQGVAAAMVAVETALLRAEAALAQGAEGGHESGHAGDGAEHAPGGPQGVASSTAPSQTPDVAPSHAPDTDASVHTRPTDMLNGPGRDAAAATAGSHGQTGVESQGHGAPDAQGGARGEARGPSSHTSPGLPSGDARVPMPSMPGASLGTLTAMALASTAAEAQAAPGRQAAGHETPAVQGQRQVAAQVALLQPVNVSTPFAAGPESASPLRMDASRGAAAHTPQAGEPAPTSAPADGGLGAQGSAAASVNVALMVPTILSALHAGAPQAASTRRFEDDRTTDDRPRRKPRRDDDDDDEALDAFTALLAVGDEEPESQHRKSDHDLPADVATWIEPWCEELAAALLNQSQKSKAQPALHVAAQQWLKGRCVVVVCPQSAHTPTLGWAFVLWRAEPGQPPALRGRRFPATLRWARSPKSGQWWALRAVKGHQAARGRQLHSLADLHVPGVTAAPQGEVGSVCCELQLGPVPAAVPRWRDLCVRVDSARTFWQSLGPQWTVHAVISADPLLAPPASAAAQAPAASATTDLALGA